MHIDFRHRTIVLFVAVAVALAIAAAVFLHSGPSANIKVAGVAVILLALAFIIEVIVPAHNIEMAENEISYLKGISKFQEIVENAPDPIVVLDRMGFLTYMNRAAENISLYSRKELIGRHFSELRMLPPASLARAIKEFAKTITGNPGPAHHLDFIRKDGSVFTVDVTHKPIINGKKIEGVEVFFKYFGEKRK